MNSIKHQLQKAKLRLEQVSDSAQLDAELLLSHVLQKPRGYLYSWSEIEISPQQIQAYEKLLLARLSGEPIAYILGEREFWSLPLKISNQVLIPRPETELLVEAVLQLIPIKHARVADLGTGSGAIALALAHEQAAWEIYATDYSANALKVAQNNAEHLGLQNIHFSQGSWCQALPNLQFDAIISNPPYIEENDPHLMQGDVRFEPREALVADAQGLADIHCIIQQAKSYLKPGAWLLLEHGYNQALAVRQLFGKYGYKHVVSKLDLVGIERISLAKMP